MSVYLTKGVSYILVHQQILLIAQKLWLGETFFFKGDFCGNSNILSANSYQMLPRSKVLMKE